MKSSDTSTSIEGHAADIGLLFLRVTGSVLLMYVHGLPKLLHYSSELPKIEDPFHMGQSLTIAYAIFAEVVCPLFMIAGIGTRLAALPVFALTIIALLFVHPQWSVAEGQFAWWILIVFGAIALAGPGRWVLWTPSRSRWRSRIGH
jgi:putative oxidoreductase